MRYMATFIYLILILSCTPVRIVSTDTEKGTDFSRYQSFGFYEIADGSAEAPNLEHLKSAIIRELGQRGLVVSENPDLKVNIALDKESKVQTRETDYRDAPRYIGTRSYHWESEEIVVNEYEEGSVKIDVVDTRTNTMVWQGIAAGTLTDNQEKMKSRIDMAMNKLFARFPVSELK